MSGTDISCTNGDLCRPACVELGRRCVIAQARADALWRVLEELRVKLSSESHDDAMLEDILRPERISKSIQNAVTYALVKERYAS